MYSPYGQKSDFVKVAIDFRVSEGVSPLFAHVEWSVIESREATNVIILREVCRDGMTYGVREIVVKRLMATLYRWFLRRSGRGPKSVSAADTKLDCKRSINPPSQKWAVRLAVGSGLAVPRQQSFVIFERGCLW